MICVALDCTKALALLPVPAANARLPELPRRISCPAPVIVADAPVTLPVRLIAVFAVTR